MITFLSKFSLQSILSVAAPIGLEVRMKLCVFSYLQTISNFGLARRFLQRVDIVLPFDDHAIPIANYLR